MLLLVGIAMPLKYVWGWPHAVVWVGWAHGALFMAFNGAALLAAFRYGWPLSKFLWLGVASVLPFGTFVADAKLLRPELDHERDVRQPSGP